MRLLMLSLALAPFANASAGPPANEKAAILTVVAEMERAWNRGDFRSYMAGFANPAITFVSNGKIQAGWQGTLDHYVRDYGGAPERRGQVHFYDMKIDILAPDAAMLVGHYHLERTEHPQEGINTRLWRKIDGKWVIAMNHVSSFETHAPPNNVPTSRYIGVDPSPAFR